jgi:uncharacterized protein (TIGR00369 family)
MSDSNAPSFAIPVSPFARKLGIVCERVEPDRAVYVMDFQDDNVTVGDVVHGGAICSLADVAATGAAWTAVTDPAKFRGTTIDISLSFVAAARSTTLHADARVVKRGGTICFIDVELRSRPGGDLVANCKVVYKLSRVESPQEKLAALFTGQPQEKQMALLAALERSGAALYRSFAANAATDAQRRTLTEGADREEANAEVLERILRG